MLCRLVLSDCALAKLLESSSGGLAGLALPPRGVKGDRRLGGRLVLGAASESRRAAKALAISPALRLPALTEPASASFSAMLRPSHGLAAIHRSTQLQPHCGLPGSVNVGFAAFELPFPCGRPEER